LSERAALVDRCPHCGRNIRQRTPEQNDALHATLADIAAQRDWPRGTGQMLTVEQWKRLMVAAWERTEGRRAEIFPAVDGQGIDVVYQRTSRLNKHEASELIEYVKAWAITEGVVLHDPQEVGS
jgi:hypothetical protein